MVVRDNNVTYVNFGARKKVSAPEEVLRLDRSGAPGKGASPAADRLMQAAIDNTDYGRLQRGREYARKGHVVGLEVRNGAVHGSVAGSQLEPFAVLIHLPYRSNDDLGQVASILARTPNSIKNVTAGKFPEQVLDILISQTGEDIRFSCDCPDPTSVCKHVVAVVDRLALKVDADPAVAFHMRGMTLANLEKLIMAKAPEVAHEAITRDSNLSDEEKNTLFWKGRDLPDLPNPKTAPALQDSDMDVLRKALRSVSHTNMELLRAMNDIEDLYDFLIH